MEASCLQGGDGYVQLCGPRSAANALLSDDKWRNTYTMHRDYDLVRMQRFASEFETITDELGGAGAFGNPGGRLAAAWFQRDISLGVDRLQTLCGRFARRCVLPPRTLKLTVVQNTVVTAMVRCARQRCALRTSFANRQVALKLAPTSLDS